MSELPEGWERVKLSHVSQRITKGSTPTSYGYEYQDKGIAFVKVENVKNGLIAHHTIKHRISEEANLNQKRSILEAGDILFSIAGTIGATCLVRKEDLPANTNQALAIIRGTSGVFNPLFLRYQLESEIGREQSRGLERGGGMNNLSLADVGNLAVAVPPLNEQRRIVAKLKKLLDRVDVAQARVATIPRILKRFRQSVLAAACSGRLTTDWRETHTAGLASFGEVSDDLPESWRKCPLSEVARISSGEAFKKSEYSEAGVRLLQIANVSFGEIIWEQQNFLPRSYLKSHSDLVLAEGDILMALNRPLLNGRIKVARLTKDDLPAILYQRVGRFSLVGGKKINPTFLFLFLQSFGFIQELSERLRGSDQPYINPPDMLEIIFPLPPFIEQQEIVRRVEALFKTADALESRYRAAKAHVDKLTQSILAKAFRGELVPQDPNDEPASLLLERIRQRRKEPGETKRRRRA